MRSPDRIDPMLAELRDLWRQHPDLRFGQIVNHAQALASVPGSLALIEDAALLEGLRELKRRINIGTGD